MFRWVLDVTDLNLTSSLSPSDGGLYSSPFPLPRFPVLPPACVIFHQLLFSLTQTVFLPVPYMNIAMVYDPPLFFPPLLLSPRIHCPLPPSPPLICVGELHLSHSSSPSFSLCFLDSSTELRFFQQSFGSSFPPGSRMDKPLVHFILFTFSFMA